MRRLTLVSALVVLAAACVPPPSGPPAPQGTGVTWIRQIGVEPTPPGSSAFEQYSIQPIEGGSVSGPGPVDAGAIPGVVAWLPFQSWRPDGTAKYPFNGFAGEGITFAVSGDQYTITYPGGSCQGFYDAEQNTSVFPSPDGSKAAIHRFSTDADTNGIAIVALTGTGCTPIVNVGYQTYTSQPRFSNKPIVWAPDSSAVVYGLGHLDTSMSSLERLEATAGAVPASVIPAHGGQVSPQVVPLGWSVADRLLALLDGNLVTLPASGGTPRVIGPSSGGYFVPDTTRIVYGDGSMVVTNSDGESFPWFRVRLIDDVEGAVSEPIGGVEPTLEWHAEPASIMDPTIFRDVPNSSYVGRFFR